MVFLQNTYQKLQNGYNNDLKTSSECSKDSTKSKEVEKRSYIILEPSDDRDRPLDRIMLGRSTWSLLHTVAVYYPDKPTKEKQKQTKLFIESLSNIYPCSICQVDFKNNVQKYPPKLGSRKDFIAWMCFQHNLVNKKLNKKIFDCSLESYEKRWKLNLEKK
tara:strand:- start:110 stop:592 length:483 start_codon:yes stop_codon:yes gene_type:complete